MVDSLIAEMRDDRPVDADLTDLEVRDPEGAEPVRPEIGQDVG